MIKFIFRWAFRLLILGIVIVVALLLLKDQIVKSIAESQIRKSTGMEVSIGSMSVSLTRPVFHLEKFVLYNTAEFGGGPMIDIPDLHLEMYPDATRKRELHFKLVRVNVRELNIVESRDGRTNITSLTAALDKMNRSSTNQNADFEFKGIDTLNLTVGKVRYVSFRQPKRNQEVNFALQNEIVQNVRSWNDMAGILFKVLIRAGVTIYLDQTTSKASTNSPSRPVPRR